MFDLLTLNSDTIVMNKIKIGVIILKKVIFIGLVIILLLSLISCGPKISYPMIKNIEATEENTGVLFRFKYDIRYKIPDENLKLEIYKNDFEKVITGTPNSE